MKNKISARNEPNAQGNEPEARKHISCDIPKSSSVGDIRDYDNKQWKSTKNFHHFKQNDLSSSLDIYNKDIFETTLRTNSKLHSIKSQYGISQHHFYRKSFNENHTNTSQNDLSSKGYHKSSNVQYGSSPRLDDMPRSFSPKPSRRFHPNGASQNENGALSKNNANSKQNELDDMPRSFSPKPSRRFHPNGTSQNENGALSKSNANSKQNEQSSTNGLSSKTSSRSSHNGSNLKNNAKYTQNVTMPKTPTKSSQAGHLSKSQGKNNLKSQNNLTNGPTTENSSIDKKNEQISLDDDLLKAKKKEIERWKKLHGCEEVVNRGFHSTQTQWVISDENPPKPKLVAKGFEAEDASAAPSALKSSLRLFFSVCATFKWEMKSMDVKSAYLQHEISRELYVMPPKEAELPMGRVWKMNKVVYGMRDTSCNWFLIIKKDLRVLKCQQCCTDKYMFRWYNNNKIEGLVLVYDNDYLFAGTNNFKNKVIVDICEKYKVSTRSLLSSKYQGMEITQTDGAISISQNVDNISEIPLSMTRTMHKSNELNIKERKQLKSLIKKLNMVANHTRPDLCFDMLKLNIKARPPKVEDILYINKIVQKLKSNKNSLLIPSLGNLENLKIILFSDYEYANLPDRLSSTGGSVIFVARKNDTTCPLLWTSNKIKGGVTNALSARCASLRDGLDSAYNVRNLLTEIVYGSVESSKIPVFTFIHHPSSSMCAPSCDDMDLASIQRSVDAHNAYLKWIPHVGQLAGCLTSNGKTMVTMTNKLLDFVKRGVIPDLRTFF